MTDLIHIQTINDDTLVCDSRDIAKGLGIDHHNFLQTVKKNQTDIEAVFGCILFQTEVPKNPTGNPPKFALITESQFLYIATLTKNTPQAKKVKSQLVQSFIKARKELLAIRQLSSVPLQIEASQDVTSCQATDSAVKACMDTTIDRCIAAKTLDDCEAIFLDGLDYVAKQRNRKKREEDLLRQLKEVKEEEDDLVIGFRFSTDIPDLSTLKRKEMKALSPSISTVALTDTNPIASTIIQLIEHEESKALTDNQSSVEIDNKYLHDRVKKTVGKKFTVNISPFMQQKGYAPNVQGNILTWYKVLE
jgi:phage regulator Rha-like protein